MVYGGRDAIGAPFRHVGVERDQRIPLTHDYDGTRREGVRAGVAVGDASRAAGIAGVVLALRTQDRLQAAAKRQRVTGVTGDVGADTSNQQAGGQTETRGPAPGCRRKVSRTHRSRR